MFSRGTGADSRTFTRSAVRMGVSGPVGFIGLGIMGLPMAQNIVRKLGREVVVWNRSPERSAILAAEDGSKVKVAETAREVVERCEVTFSMLSTPEAVEAVYFNSGKDSVLEGVAKGKRIVDCSTLTEAASVRSHDAVVAKGGLFLEAPVSGSKVPAENGALIFLCGGDKETFEMVRNS